MKVSINTINSIGIRNEMSKDHYATAHFLGTYRHPKHTESRDWDVTLYYAADSFVLETNGDPIWENAPGFAETVAEYGIDIEQARKDAGIA